MTISSDQQELFDALIQRAALSSTRFFLVGGIVRDLLMSGSLADRDVDILVQGSAAEEARWLVERFGGECRSFPKFLTAKAEKLERLTELQEVDFATARTESYERPGALPTVSASDIAHDLSRRDFTINAMAVEVTEKLVEGLSEGGFVRTPHDFDLLDPYNGFEDLQRRVLRVLHHKSFLDDPTRVLRGIRYAARIRGKFEPATEALIREAVNQDAFETVSHQRFSAELQRIALESTLPDAIELLQLYNCRNSMGISQIFLSKEFQNATRLIPVSLRGKERLSVVFSLLMLFGREDIDEQEWFAFGLSRKQLTRVQSETLQAENSTAVPGSNLKIQAFLDALLTLKKPGD